MRIRCRRGWGEGQARSATLVGGGVTVTLTAKCVWSRRDGWCNHVIGVAFEGVSAEEQRALAMLAEGFAAQAASAPSEAA